MRKPAITVLMLCLLCAVTVEVHAQYPPGYVLETTGTGFAAESGEQFLGFPSIRMGTVTTADQAAIVFNGGPQLGSIDQLSYWTYTEGAGTFGQLTAWIAIYLHVQPGKTYDDWVTDYLAASPDVFYLQAEPYYTTGNPVLNTWQLQDAFGGSALKWVGLESPDYPHEAPTLADYISGAATNFLTTSYGNQAFASREYGTLYISAIKIRMGYGGPWANTLAFVDNINIDGYLESFHEEVPTLSEWGMMILLMLTTLAAMWVLRRHRAERLRV